MASVAEKIGELNGTVKGLSERVASAEAENNRRWEEHQRMLDDRFKQQGERVGSLDKKIDIVSNDLIQHQLRCHKGNNGSNGGYTRDKLKHHAIQIGLPTAGGIALLFELLKKVFAK